jgi:hypothetical protein
MSQEKDGGQQSTLYYVAQETPRLLETADGWKLVGYNDRELGRADGVTARQFEVPVKDDGVVRGDGFFIEKLYWNHAWGLLYLQGMPLQKLLGPNYLLIRVQPCSIFDARPHVKNVHLARIQAAPQSLRLEELVVELRRWFT